ncbi:hypothetical protein Catovirus_1_599 [Catovirus CTV1]|uniref:Uncharacterized protein n=1 Tax=Catovirus CTV1 TaxID=1977631 RepID=A0A1V0SA27_9VIRU|nr:hypothetical protein Catovirus_1_599 [Catovirus CTV1]
MTICANYLPLKDSIKLQYLCKNLFEFRMEYFVFHKLNVKFLEKHAESIFKLDLTKAVGFSFDNI